MAQPPPHSGAWLAIRRPLLVALVFGCAVSLITSGRLSLRLVAPATLYWSFVLLLESCAGFTNAPRSPPSAPRTITASDRSASAVLTSSRKTVPNSILEAVRRRRTVVYDRDGRAWGDPQLIRLAAGRLRGREPQPAGSLDLFSRAAGLLGLIGFLISGHRVVYSAKEKEIVPK